MDHGRGVALFTLQECNEQVQVGVGNPDSTAEPCVPRFNRVVRPAERRHVVLVPQGQLEDAVQPRSRKVLVEGTDGVIPLVVLSQFLCDLWNICRGKEGQSHVRFYVELKIRVELIPSRQAQLLNSPPDSLTKMKEAADVARARELLLYSCD